MYIFLLERSTVSQKIKPFRAFTKRTDCHFYHMYATQY